MLVTAALAMLVPIVLLPGDSYRRLTPRDEARLYASRGAVFLGRRLHLHLPPGPFLKSPVVVQPLPRGTVYHQYLYQRTRFLVAVGNPYYRQFQRKRKAGKTVCVKGRVARLVGGDATASTAVFVGRIRAITPPPKRKRRTAVAAGEQDGSGRAQTAMNPHQHQKGQRVHGERNE